LKVRKRWKLDNGIRSFLRPLLVISDRRVDIAKSVETEEGIFISLKLIGGLKRGKVSTSSFEKNVMNGNRIRGGELVKCRGEYEIVQMSGGIFEKQPLLEKRHLKPLIGFEPNILGEK
jgi:hypothetical protein